MVNIFVKEGLMILILVSDTIENARDCCSVCVTGVWLVNVLEMMIATSLFVL